jgi:hypothetical protein
MYKSFGNQVWKLKGNINIIAVGILFGGNLRDGSLGMDG